MHPISGGIINWYTGNCRDLPWRKTRNPYFIWLSEVILQQTRVAQGMAYYQRFITRFPSVEDLAAASQDEVMEVWQGLGYYSRARNLHATAKRIAEEYSGRFPGNYEGLLRLKGIGPYTAAAISSFAFGEDQAVLDGNVVRVLSRLFAVSEDVTRPAVVKKLRETAAQLLPVGHSYLFNQGIMELGALVCTPRSPDCTSCPVREHCAAAKAGIQQNLPLKKKATQKKLRYLNYLVLEFEDQILLRKRGADDIWEGLYEPLLAETPHPFTLPEEFFQAFPQLPPGHGPLRISAPVRHILTHRELWVTFAKCRLEKQWETDGGVWVKLSESSTFAKPVVISKFLGEDRKSPLSLGF